MNPRLEKQLQSLAVIVACGATAGLVFNVPQGRSAIVGMTYGIMMSSVLGAIEMFVLSGSLRDWLGRFSFTVSLAIRSAIYAVGIAVLAMDFNRVSSSSACRWETPPPRSGTASSIPPRCRCCSTSALPSPT